MRTPFDRGGNMPTFCPQCGKPLQEGARFCGNCGATVAATSPSPAPALQTAAPAAAGAAPGIESMVPPGAVPPAGAAMAGLVERVKRILLSPRTEWPVIAAEPKTARDIYLGYVAPLAAIGVIASFIGSTTIGVSVPLLGTMRMPVVPALLGAILHYALTFVGVFVVALIVDVLAPTFGGQKDALRALKLTAYSFTAAWVAGAITIIPMLGILALLGSLYGLYLLYLGLPVLMRNPEDKSIGYTIVVVICAIVLMFIVSMLSGAVITMMGYGAGMLGRTGQASDAQSADAAAALVSKMMGGQSSDDQARMKAAMSTLQKMGAQADKAEKDARAAGKESAAAGANAVDMSAAMNAVGTMLSGGKDVQPVDFHHLKDLLPASLPGGLDRTEASGQSGEAMGMKGSSATATYSDGAHARVTIEIADLGSLSGLAGMASRFDPKMEKETATGYERTRTVSGQLVHEQYDRQSRSGETGVLVNNRFSVTVRGRGVDAAQLTGALQAVDMSRLAKVMIAK
jgi:hypothetical protein